MTNTVYIHKGDIFWLSLTQASTSSTSIQQGNRPYIVISSNSGCISSPVISVIPCTTKFKSLSVNVTLSYNIKGLPMQALCNQIQTIQRELLLSHNYIGRVTDMDLSNIDEAICKAYSLHQTTPSSTPLADMQQQFTQIAQKIKEECLSLTKDLSFTEKLIHPQDKKPYLRRTTLDKIRFMEDWQSSMTREEVAMKHHFSSVSVARATYGRWLPWYQNLRRSKSNGTGD